MSIYGGRKKQPRKVFEKQTYVSRICLKCRANYQRRITKRNRYNNYMRRWMRENRPSRRKKNV